MLNVGELNEGFVLDHIEAGKAMMIYNYLGLDKLDCQVAIIKLSLIHISEPTDKRQSRMPSSA